MGFTRENKLHGILGIVYNLRQPIEIGKEQMCTLVRCKTAGKTNKKRIGIDTFDNRHNTRRISLILDPLIPEFATYKIDEFIFHHLTHIPNVFIGNIIDFLPKRTVILVSQEFLSQMFYIKFFPFRSSPRRHVYPIGYITYMQLIGRITFPDRLEHTLRHLAVQPADTVDFLTSVAGKHAHTELFAGSGILASQIHQLTERDTEFGRKLSHIFAEERLIEIVVSGRNRRMHGIKRRSSYNLQCLGKRELLVLYIIDQTLYIDKRRMAFIAMIHIFLYTQTFEHENTADTEQILLLHAVFPIPAIKLVSDRTVELAVKFQIGIHQIQRHTSYIHAPNIGIYDAAGIRNFEYNGVSVFIDNLFDGKLVEILGFIVGQLLTIHRESLGKIAVTIKETHGNHVDIAVAGFF